MIKPITVTSQVFANSSLPHNFLAEQMVLNCLLTNSKLIEDISHLISVETFYFQNHQEIYKAILEMIKNNLPVNILTVAAFLQEKNILEKVGGTKVLLELANQVSNPSSLEEYVRLIRDKFIRRGLIKLGYEMIHSSYITNVSLENILATFESELLTLTNEIVESKICNSAQLLNSIFSELKEKFLNPGLPGIASGFPNLDLLTQGFQKSDLIIIAGRPSMGKTAFSLNIAMNVIKNLRLPVLFFSLEMSKEQIMYRMLATETDISQARLKSGQLYQKDWIKLNSIIKIVSKLPLFIDDSPTLSVQEIRSKAKTVVSEQNRVGLIIVDYLQLMQSSRTRGETRVEELSQITRHLKSIAREFNVPVISLSQLSRSVENRLDQKPILSDLRESGSIEQDADLVLMLSNSKVNNLSSPYSEEFKSLELIIAKHRNGPTGTLNLSFDKKQTKFSDFS